MKKKLLSLVLAFAMIISMFSGMPITASATEYTSSDYTYTLSNNQATITKASSDLSGSVTIPSSLDGHTVVAIGNSVFSGNASITSVVIPNTVTTIDSYAFKNCSGITSLTIGSKVTSIGYEAFRLL